MSFSQKVVFITGASSGIGAAIAIEFAKEGANVIIVGRNEVKMKNISEKCETYGKKPLVIKADISKNKEVIAAVKKTIETFGKLDVLVNNAGILKCINILDKGVLECYDELMGTNLRAVVHLTTLAAPYLIKTKGNIVNISSVSGSCITHTSFGLYSVTKAGLNHFTRAAALELAPYGVRVNAISPGPVDTDILENTGPSIYLDDIKINTPLGRSSKSVEIADLVLFLSSEKAKACTGCNYVSDNGFLLTK
ncbi:unnamed protein product [Parnassius apollo]|uniref:(apollo) hypothetical protein n=1 Tax=Parnassius apollo TaxID=110799 RepID=A0A8S3WN89_PARAO|nr:unnamed protein product [Parnassius apollo]